MKILITGGTSATALKLIKAFPAHEIVLGDYNDVPKFNSDAYQLISLGEKNLDTIAHTLLNNCLDHQIDMILPIASFEIEAVAISSVLFEEFGIEVLLPASANLPQYFDAEKKVKSTDWIVFSKGEMLYATSPTENLTAQGKKESLSGAFYVAEKQLILISI